MKLDIIQIIFSAVVVVAISTASHDNSRRGGGVVQAFTPIVGGPQPSAAAAG